MSDNIQPPPDTAVLRDRLATAMHAYLAYDNKLVFGLIKNPDYLQALDFAGGCPARTPLYIAYREMLESEQVNSSNNAEIACRISDILCEIELCHGKKAAVNVGNAINHCHNVDFSRKPFTATLRDLLEASPDGERLFLPIIDRFQLLRQRDMVKEQLPTDRQVSDIELKNIRPFR